MKIMGADNLQKITKYLLLAAVIICSFSEGLKQLLFGLPIVHVGNLLVIVLFVLAIYRNGIHRLWEKELRPFAVWIAAFVVVGTVSAVIFRPGIMLYLWALRTYFRMFLLLFDCIMILDAGMIGLLRRLLNVVIVIHVGLTGVQFIFFGVRWDYLNGIFGTAVADSSCLHALLLINSCLCLYELGTGRMSSWMFILHYTWMCLNSAVSEIRVWFYEIVILIVVYLIFTRDFKRLLKMSPVLVIIFIGGMILMAIIYPYTSDFFGIAGFLGIVSEHHLAGSEKAIGRKNQIFAMTGPILETAKESGWGYGVLPLITGLGFGSAEYSTTFIESAFFTKYGYLGYPSFLLSFLYVETGIIGLVIFNLIWIFLLMKGIQMVRDGWEDGKKVGLLQVFFSLALLITACYNQTLRSNYGYIMWVFLGVVVVLARDARES